MALAVAMPPRRLEGPFVLASLAVLGLACLRGLLMAFAQFRGPGFRAVVTDVDGTLMPFGTNAKLSKKNRQALQTARDRGLEVCVATGRIPGPWYDELRAQVPLGPGVFANGALVLEAGPTGAPKILAAATLPASAVATVLQCTSGGRFRGLRVSVLAATIWEGSLRYLELAPEGPTWATDLIRSAGEPEMVLRPKPYTLHPKPKTLNPKP